MESSKELIAAQNEVQAQMGRNLLNYQGIEILLKLIVKFSALEVRKNLDGELCAKHTKTDRMMLGLLFGAYISDIVVLSENDTHCDSDGLATTSNESFFSFRFTQELFHPDQLEVLKSKTKQLVDDRNELVHHFREVYSLDSVDSCQLALIHLTERNAFCVYQLEYFKQTATELENARSVAAEILAREDVKECLIGEIEYKPESLH